MDQNDSRAELDVLRDQHRILGLAEGFFQSSILFALLKLRVFELIGDAVKPLGELANELGARPATLARLLNAAVALELLETVHDSSYRLSPASRSAFLVPLANGYLGNWIRSLAFLSVSLQELHERVLQTNSAVEHLGHIGGDKEETENFIWAMHDYGATRGKELADYLDTTGCKNLLDLGCGSGIYSFILGMKNPRLALHLLDSRDVLQIAKSVQSNYRLVNNVHYHPANILTDEVAGEFDIVLVSNLLHLLGHAESVVLLKRAYKMVAPGGSLVVQAQFLRDDRLGGRWPIFLDLVQLCTSREGANHSVQETKSWLQQAGFARIEFCQMSLVNTNSYLRAYKPSAVGISSL
jgi:SAM-dependent methyltransferase